MADVRSLLKNERAARRIAHPHATYSTKGALVCLVCNIQLKSDSLWNGHLRSPQHAARLQKLKANPTTLLKSDSETQLEEGESDGKSAALKPQPSEPVGKKRGREDEVESVRKKSKSGGLPDGFFDDEGDQEIETPSRSPQEIQLVSRPATPLKTPTEAELIPQSPVQDIDEDEWAAFEADIAAEEEPVADGAVISAAPMTAEELAAKARQEESAQRKEKQEAEMEGDKEDAARKLEEEFDEMVELEDRVRKLKEKREALRMAANEKKVPVISVPMEVAPKIPEDDVSEDDEEDEDDWSNGFMMR